MVADGIRGVTANPTIFARSITGSHDYDEQFSELMAAGKSVDEAYWELVISDASQALAVLRPVFDGGDCIDGFVSVEVSPELAHDAPGNDRRRAVAAPSYRPTQSAREDSRNCGRRHRRRSTDRRGCQHQRDAVVLACPGTPRSSRPTCPGWRSSPPTAAIPRPSAASPRSSSAGSTPRSTSDSRRSAPTRRSPCAARPRSRRPSWPTGCSPNSSLPSAGTGSPAWAQMSSVRCGPRRPPRTPRTATPATSRNSSAPKRSRPCPKQPSPPSRITARWLAPSTTVCRKPAELMQRLAAVGVDMTAVGRTLEDNGIASFNKAYQDVLANLTNLAADPPTPGLRVHTHRGPLA